MYEHYYTRKSMYGTCLRVSPASEGLNEGAELDINDGLVVRFGILPSMKNRNVAPWPRRDCRQSKHICDNLLAELNTHRIDCPLRFYHLDHKER